MARNNDAHRWTRFGDLETERVPYEDLTVTVVTPRMLYRAMALTWELARRTNPRRFTPGVYRYRNADEMNLADEQRLREHLRARRHAPDRETPTR